MPQGESFWNPYRWVPASEEPIARNAPSYRHEFARDLRALRLHARGPHATPHRGWQGTGKVRRAGRVHQESEGRITPDGPRHEPEGRHPVARGTGRQRSHAPGGETHRPRAPIGQRPVHREGILATRRRGPHLRLHGTRPRRPTLCWACEFQ